VDGEVDGVLMDGWGKGRKKQKKSQRRRPPQAKVPGPRARATHTLHTHAHTGQRQHSPVRASLTCRAPAIAQSRRTRAGGQNLPHCCWLALRAAPGGGRPGGRKGGTGMPTGWMGAWPGLVHKYGWWRRVRGLGGAGGAR
jgi:hypothetical protein